MTTIKNHLYRNDVKKSVVNEECNNIIRAGNDIMQQCYIINSGEEQPKVISKRYSKADTNFIIQNKSKNYMWIRPRTLEKDQRIDYSSTKSSTKK